MFLRRLNVGSDADREVASRLFLSNPNFELEHFGRLPTSDMAEPLWQRFPEQCAPEHRLLFAAFDHEEPIGLAQVALHLPTAEYAALTLLLVPQQLRKQHIGCQILERLSKQARRWSGISSWYISVAETNTSALAFWRHCGFRSINAGKAVPGFAHKLITLTRPIKARPMCQRHGAPEDAADVTAQHLFSRLT